MTTFMFLFIVSQLFPVIVEANNKKMFLPRLHLDLLAGNADMNRGLTDSAELQGSFSGV